MVDRNRASSFDYPYADPDPYRDGVGVSDYGRALQSGAAGIGSFMGAAIRSLGELRDDDEQKALLATEYLGRAMQGYFGDVQEGAIASMSPAAARDIQATFTDPNFWSLASISLKATQMAPEIAVSVIPAVLAPGAIASAAALAATGASISAASVVDELYSLTDQLSDAELQEQAQAYRARREQGIDEETARREYNAELRGMKPLLTGVIGAVTNMVGPAGIATRALRPGGAGPSLVAGAEASLGRRIAGGFAEGAIAETVQSGVEGGVVQQGMVDVGSQESIDWGAVAEQAGEGAVLGGILGGAVGAAGGRAGGDSASEPLVDRGAGQEHGVPLSSEMPSPSPTAPNQPGGGVPAQGPAATPAAGAVPPSTVQPSPRAAPSGMGEGVSIVDGASPDPAQTAALAAREMPTTSAPNQPGADVPSPNIPSPGVAPVEVSQGVTPEGNAAREMEVRTPVAPPPVQGAPEGAEATVGAAVARPDPSTGQIVDQTRTAQQPAEPVVEVVNARPDTEQARSGPRILETRDGPDYSQQWAQRVDRNIAEAEQPASEPQGRNRTQAELQQRQATREGTTDIAKRFPPSELEMGLLSRRPQEVQVARRLMMDRVQSISQEAEKMGLTLPKAFRDSTDTEAGYNPETLLVMEARRLASKSKPTPADYKRFFDRELSVRTGDVGQAVAERRAEGDAAMRQTTEATLDAVSDDSTPEAILIRAEEEGLARKASPKEKAPTRAKTEEAKPLPPRIEKILDDLVAGAAKRQPVVETRKKRVISKPAPDKVTPKVTPKVEEAKARVKDLAERTKERVVAARQQTNTKPTPAQIEAGNYKKGSVPVQGMTVRIENPKGSTRSGTDADGQSWSVKLKNDYGYIEGTRGADGDAVDVYLGPRHDATYVYVVDQVDPFSKAFDEHKALMGFADDADAFIAYTEAFSDGRGADRMGGMRKMTMDEFKKWLETSPSERASMTEADVAEVQAFLVEEAIAPSIPRKVTNERPSILPTGTVADPYSGRVVRPITTQSATDIMGTFDLSGLNAYQRAVAGQARRMLTELVGNTPIHFINNADMARITGRNNIRGVFSADADGNQVIFVRADLMADTDALRHVVLHEATHAATIRAVRDNKTIEGNIRDVMASTVEALDSLQVLDDGSLDYALSQPKEFIAEVLSNPRVQTALAHMEAPDALVQRLGMQRGRIRSAWDALVHTIRKALGLPENATSMLEAALRVTEPAMAPRLGDDVGGRSFLIDGNLRPLQKSMKERANALLNRPELQPSTGKPWLYRLRTMDSLSRAADKLFGGAESNPFRKIAQLIEAQRVRATKHYEDATPLLQKTHELQNRYEKQRGENGQSVWENFAALTIDETTSGVFADRPLSEQKHITAGPRDSWQRAQHPELARRYNMLPDDLKQHRQNMLAYFKDQQQKLSYGIIKNRLVKLFDVSGVEGGAEALATRIHNGTVTEADKVLLGDAYDAIQAAGVLSKIDGPYYPLMRRGNWVLVARQPVTKPGNAREVSPNEYEFTDVGAAEKFAAAQTGRPTIQTVYVDPATGDTFGMENGQQVRLTAQDMNVEQRWRVSVQDKNVEMFDTQAQARARGAELAAAGMQVDDAVPRNFDNYGAQAEALSPQIARMMQVLERRADARNFTPQQKHELLQSVSEASLQMMASTRIQTRSLPRRNVAGASKDLTRNIHDYALAMGNHLSKLEIGPQIDAHVAEAREYIDTHRNDGMNGARQEVYNEVATRVTMKDPRTEGGATNTVVNRVLAVSFIDKLMSPSYSVINATQPMMITMPYLSANYGIARSMGAMSKAYRDIGSMQTITQGFRDTIAKARSGEIVPTDPASLIIARLSNARERQMLEFMVEKGALDTDAGLEVSKLMQDRRGLLGRMDGGLSYLEGIARQMPKAVEAVNRSVSALAAYRLEMDRSGDHTKAVQFAYDTVNRTQFNYSHTNANRLMNHPMLRIATQFKKYGVGMYQFLGEQAGIAISAASTPAERVAAIKALSYTIGMHVAIAGAMGLPTEPIKLMVTAANALGITDWTWTDVEIGQREAMAGLFGRDLGEALSRGIPRLAGLDLSTRMGIDTLMGPFGEPRSNEAQDLKAYMWDALSGAPAGLIFDMTGGIGNLVEGDVMRAMERLVPVKAFSDTLKAYRQMTEGSISQSSGRQVMSPYSVSEAIMRGIGFAPAREAEAFERSNMFYHTRASQEERRRDYQREWSEANGAARGRIWREIQKWNKGQPREVRLSLSDLRRYKTRLEADMRQTKEGLRARRREQHILDRVDSTFNFEP